MVERIVKESKFTVQAFITAQWPSSLERGDKTVPKSLEG